LTGKLLLLAALCALATSARAGEPFQTATMDQVQEWIAGRAAIVYDVNTDEVYEKNHLPGARFIAGKKWVQTLPADKGARLVFYCSNPR
jgi:rhodanese-related sulfurtransferase